MGCRVCEELHEDMAAYGLRMFKVYRVSGDQGRLGLRVPGLRVSDLVGFNSRADCEGSGWPLGWNRAAW